MREMLTIIRVDRVCGGKSRRFSRKSSGTSACSAKKLAQLGSTGVINSPSPCLRIRTSLTSAGKHNSYGSHTARLAPFRNIEARLETAPDMDLALHMLGSRCIHGGLRPGLSAFGCEALAPQFSGVIFQ
jgi:hypothetical protein